MPDLKGIENLSLVVAFVVPGLIISFVRAQFITARLKSHTENVLAYVTLSLLYYGLTIPALEYVASVEGPRWYRALAWFALVVLGPALLGLLLGSAAQYGWGRWFAHKIRLNPVHSAPTAWDWRFSTLRGNRFVMVTLSDGSTVAGVFGEKSFVSSEPTERDIYIEEIYDVAETGVWTARSEPIGILIPSKEIRYVQFW
jgi:hypothetical protein